MNAQTAIAPAQQSTNDIIQDIYKGTPRQIRSWVEECTEAGLVPFVQSSPGLGKSAIMRSVADNYLLELIDHRLIASDPTDFNGIPRFNDDGTAGFAPFSDLFPLEGISKIPEGKQGWFLFFDEANQATKTVMAAMYKPVLDRIIGQAKMHSNVRMALAGNLTTDRAYANGLSTAMQSRLVHLEMIESFDEWLEDFAIPNGIDNRIIAFLHYKSAAFYDFKPDHKEKTFCCPRTWDFMDKLIRNKEVKDANIPLYGGTITHGYAVDFVQFTKVYASMIKIEDVARDWDGIAAPRDAATRWAVVSHLADKVSKDTIVPVMNFIQKAGNFDVSFKILFYRMFTMTKQDLRTHPKFQEAMLELNKTLRR